MKKIKLKKVKKIKISTKITLIIISLFFSIYCLISIINKNVYPILMKYATVDAKKMALLIIENSVNDKVINTLNEEDIFEVSKNKDGEVSDIDFNPVVVNKVLSLTTNIVSNNLKKLEKGKIDNISFIDNSYNKSNLKNGVISKLPIGLATKNALLSNIGPKIPVKINLVGNVVSYITIKVENYGINSSLICVYAHVEVSENVMIPFKNKEIKITNDIPIAMKVVQGKVPEYYGGSFNTKNSNMFSLPVDIDN